MFTQRVIALIQPGDYFFIVDISAMLAYNENRSKGAAGRRLVPNILKKVIAESLQ